MTTTATDTAAQTLDWLTFGAPDALALDGCTYEVEKKDGTCVDAIAVVTGAEEVDFYRLQEDAENTTDDDLVPLDQISRFRWLGH